MKALVSVIIPTYNRADLIGATLDSMIAQTYQDWECIVVDDGSTDNTEEILSAYSNKDSRFYYYKRPDNRTKGANACRNYGFEKSKGAYIKWFDSDDILYSDFLEKQVRILEEDKELDFCACLAEDFTEGSPIKTVFRANRTPKEDVLTAYLTKNHYFFTAAPLWRRITLEGKALFDEELANSHETDFHFRMLANHLKYVYKDDVLFGIRRGHQSITQDKANELSSHISRLKFFTKAFKIVATTATENQNTLQQYLLYRQLSSFYQIKINSGKTIKGYGIQILKNIFNTAYPLQDKIRIYIGFILITISNKGYNFLKSAKIDINEAIEN
ncbi:glycosyltransferase family 2 protein [Flavobacterium sp.]|uniref:glycosyltransferase family 2 protein n=1 Tax=Flavobacterium sp. TaxID=239 RepID=UPI002614559B|nr:glycosyltransferase family 2 protein [Flavobacterium sp.]